MSKQWMVLLCAVLGCGEVVKTNPDAATEPPDADLCTGVCECRVDTDCSAVHTGCNDQGTSRTCECVAGYTKNLGGDCEFSGIVADPGFQATSAWNPNGATIDVNLNEAGMIEPGAARFTGMAGMCALPRVTQSLSMPKLSRAANGRAHHLSDEGALVRRSDPRVWARRDLAGGPARTPDVRHGARLPG